MVCFTSLTVPSALTSVGLPTAIDPEAFNLISGAAATVVQLAAEALPEEVNNCPAVP